MYIGISPAEDVRKRKGHHKQQNENDNVQKADNEHIEAHGIQIVTNQSTKSHLKKICEKRKSEKPY